ncbi:Erg28-like protein [Wolfiporia cocos MD-104 SS10]|uniref:Erg28-like protein n=1 Tax=Wolfiporia cocos (strain MD-104) TaxID=742152 RepID=A0A2H3JJA7_WOLCO|nr:Erg28-like protein [Wolfiporia cocos MD-104 SS10]
MAAIVDYFVALLPQAEGWLPKWQLLVAVTAFFNTVQNFATLKFTRRLYSAAPQTVTALQARTFAIWTLTSAAIRLYAAYNIHTKQVYDLALFSYLFAFAHFGSEILIFRSANINGPVVSPVVVSTVSLVWMFLQYDYYVQN